MAWLFPRLRAGAAAAMSGALGLAVLIGGATTSGSAVLAGRVSPGTVLGVAATASGALLMALAGRILVRSRRREGGRVWRWVRRVGWSGVAVVLAVIVSVGVEVGLAGPAEDVRVTSLSPWPPGSRTSTPYPCRASILARQAPSPTREHDHCRAVGRRNVGGGEPELADRTTMGMWRLRSSSRSFRMVVAPSISGIIISSRMPASTPFR